MKYSRTQNRCKLDSEFSKEYKKLYLDEDTDFKINRIFKELRYINRIDILNKIKYDFTDGKELISTINDSLIEPIKDNLELFRLYLALNGMEDLEEFIYTVKMKKGAN